LTYIADFVEGTLGEVDVGVWRDVPPAQLANSPELLDGYEPHEAAARALKYARSAGSMSYDEIGFRALAVTPTTGYVPLQTFAQARLDARLDSRRSLPPGLATLFEQTPKLRHRPLAIPDGRAGYTIDSDMIHLTLRSELGDVDDGVVWSFPLGAPPSMLLDSAQDSDVPLLFTQHNLVNPLRVNWLPLLALVDAGQFGPMQQCRTELVSETFAGNFYCFLSHRWLTPAAPDPDGMQARLTAWQLVSALCEAIYVAQGRGLHVPRKVSDFVNSAVGPSGSGLAESLIVNVLRYALDAAGLAEVHAEILPLQEITADNGVRAGHADSELTRLRELIAGHRLLRSLLERVHIWYDYSCLPQEPRTADEQVEFEQGMRQLGLLQLVGRTAILLDEADDYLTRAWCTLEALTADAAGNFDVLVGANRSTVVKGATEHHLTMLLQDRPHVVWRALLDTEVFGVQAPDDCLSRLELAATNESDLPIIYAGLRDLGAPKKIHIDGSEVVTGTFPLPVVDRGRTVLLPATSSRKVDRSSQSTGTTTLDWSEALRLDQDWGEDGPVTASHLGSDRHERRSCHVVVIGSCEGEAELVSNWVMARTAELERAMGARVTSLTWLATDVAPVGHFADGTLRTTMIDAPVWVLVSGGVRFERCAVVGAVINTLVAAEVPFVTVAVDSRQDNLARYAPPAEGDSDAVVCVDVRQARMTEWRGGLFRDHVFGELRRAVAGGSR